MAWLPVANPPSSLTPSSRPAAGPGLFEASPQPITVASGRRPAVRAPVTTLEPQEVARRGSAGSGAGGGKALC